MTNPMHLSPAEILNAWMRYTDYNPDRTKFNLCNKEYVLHRCNANLSRFRDYDPTGALGVIYVRSVFDEFMQDTRIRVSDFLNDPHGLDEDLHMHRLLHSPGLAIAEQGLLDAIDKLVVQSTGHTMIGQRDLDAEKAALTSSATAVIEQLDNCNVDLFLRGGPMQDIHKFNTHIHLFERLSECLLALEHAPDGMYLCYINNAGTADGYFGFYIKSNGNLLSINERVNEAYPGQHKCSRNGRWSEQKQFQLFPYEYIFSFSDYDYKGYATKYLIDQDKLAFFNLPAGAYMPLILAMVLLANKYKNFDPQDQPVKYLDSMLDVNVKAQLPGVQALAIPDDSQLALVQRGLTLDINSESIRTGAFAQRLNDPDRHYLERGEFPDQEPIFARLYGDGFQLDADRLLQSNTHLLELPGPGDREEDMDRIPNAEFVGTKARMEVIAYMNGRKQLAEYIRDRMYEEYQAFGGIQAVRDWYRSLLQTNRDKLFRLCVEKHFFMEQGGKNRYGNPHADDQMDRIAMFTDCKGYISPDEWGWGHWGYRSKYPFNETTYDKRNIPSGIYACPITGAKASIFFAFRFGDWTQLAGLFGEDNIPKLVQGWQSDRSYYGNPLLSATDAVTAIGTVLEDYEVRQNKRLWTQMDWKSYFNRKTHIPSYEEIPDDVQKESSRFSFDFAIGFSRRGFKQLIKEHPQQDKTQAAR